MHRDSHSNSCSIYTLIGIYLFPKKRGECYRYGLGAERDQTPPPVPSTRPPRSLDASLLKSSQLANEAMPPRKKATEEDAAPPAEPQRRSTRIREAPPKPAPVAPVAKPEKKTKKKDPALEEYRPSGVKKTTKKRKKADVEKEDGGAEGAAGDAADEEGKPKKKVRSLLRVYQTKERAWVRPSPSYLRPRFCFLTFRLGRCDDELLLTARRIVDQDGGQACGGCQGEENGRNQGFHCMSRSPKFPRPFWLIVSATLLPCCDGHMHRYQTRTERRKSGVVNVQPTIEEAAETKAEEVALVVGAMLPQMKVKNEKGEEIEVSTLAAESGVVIFVASKADTREYT